MDERSGSVLLEQSVNDVSGIASAFGAARIYIPIATFRQLFAWEQVKKCLIALTAFNDANGDVYFGSSVDRTDAGIKRFTGLYKMFEDLLKLKGMDAKDRSAFVANQSPRAVLNNWFEFQPGLLGQVGLSPAEDRRARLVYVNPFVSWDDPDFERVTAKNINVRTFDEHRASGHSETREASATRFADEMANILQIFVNREGGENSLETGRRMVLEKMTAQLADKVDEMVLDEMRRSKLATWDPSHREDGTPASRLWREIGSMIAGPVTDTIAIIGQMVADVGQNRARAQRAYTDAIQTLKDFRPGGLARMRNWVEPLQIDARDQAYQYARTEQMYVLLQLTQELLGVVKARLQLWGSVFDEVFMTLAIGDPSRPGDGSGAIGVVGREYLERLEGRLRRLATFRSARISCLPFSETDPDTSMQGFRDVLRDLAVKGDGGTEVGEQRAALAEWQVNVVDGQPRCILRLGGAEFGLRDLVGLHRQLFNQFSTHVENKLRSVDIFDFVDYLQARVLGFQLSDLTNILSQESAVLISTAVEEEAVLVYHEPQAESKQAMSNAIAAELRGLYNTMQTISVHTDRHSISLIRLKKPADEQVVDIQTCNADYLGKQGQSLTGAAVQDDLLYRAQVYHMFPHELEAWYIERWHLRHQEGPVTLAPRIVRLLEDPAMTQSLIRCLVTGAVFRNDDGKWLWKNPAPGGRFPEVFLTDHASDDYEDLLRAANTFCLQREDCRVGVAVAITRERAVESYEIENQRNGQLNEWMAGNDIGVKQVHRFLDEYLPAPVIGDVHVLRRYAAERKGMELLFRFYAHPKTHVGLRHRTELLPIGG
ncbi:MAG: hypothetical protein IPL60_12195 [Ardenticatenia bacterium]|nr:hypothetical protein [Ardenticatenia bacterium]